MSSSLLPLNMLPTMTSIQPWIGCRTTSIDHLLRAREILSGLSVDANQIAGIHEWRHLHDQTGFERRRFHLRARGGPLDAGRGVQHLQIDGLRELDADWLLAVELHLNRHLGLQVVDRIAQRVTRDVDLLV